MTDYTNKFIYSFEERGLDTLRTSIRDFERMMDEISSKAGGYAGAFQSIAHEISSVGSRARTAAANVDALAQSLRNASATPFSVSLPGGVYGTPMSPMAPSAQITPAPIQPVSTAATPPPSRSQNPALSIPYQGRSVFPNLAPPVPPPPTALYPQSGYWDNLGLDWRSRASTPHARALAGGLAFSTDGYGTHTVHRGSGFDPEQGMNMSRVNSAAADSRTMGGFDMFGMDGQAKKLGTETTNAARSVDNLTQSASRSKGVLADFGRTIGHVATGFVAWQMMDSVIRTMEKYLTVQREVNDAMAEYRVATGATAEEAAAFIESSFGSSLASGIPLLDASGTLSQTRRVGVGDEIAEYAGQLQRVSGLDALQSSRELISLQRQFPTMDMEDILGSLIGAYQRSTFSGFNEIFDTLDVAGPTSRQLGTDLGGFVGLAAGATTVTSLGPNQVEQGIRRISGVYADPNSDFRRSLARMGVSTTSDTGGLRDFVDVFNELSSGMSSGEFSTQQIQELANNIPNIMGTAFGEMFTAMLEGAENVQVAVESSRDSQDKWADAFTTKMDTLSGAVGQFSAAWDIFLASLEGSGVLKSLLNFGTSSIIGGLSVDTEQFSGRSRSEIVNAVASAVGIDAVTSISGSTRNYRTGEDVFDRFGDPNLPAGVPVGALRKSLSQQYGELPAYEYMAKIESALISADNWVPTGAAYGRPQMEPYTPGRGGVRLPEYDSQRVIQVSNREEADSIISAYEQRRENLSKSFDLSGLETGMFTFVDEFGNAITTAEGEIAILGSAASFAASALNGLAGTPTTLPAGMDPEMFSIMYAQREAQYTAAGVYNPATAKTQPHLLTDEYANVLGLQDRDPNITSAVLQEYNKTQADQRAADAQAESARRKAEADAERAAKEQAQYLKDIRDGISAFGDRLLTPSAVTAVDMYRSTNPNALSGYEDKFDEPIRRLRADIEARMNNQPLKYGDELARAQELGFFPAGIKDVTGSPEKMRGLLEGQLAEYEEAFYNRQLPMESYDWDIAVKQFAKEQQADKNKELFTDTLIGKLQEAKEAGLIEDFVPEDVKRKYTGSNFTNMLFGDKAPESIAEEVAPYGDAIQKTLFKGFQDTTKDADYVGVMITSIRAQVQEEGNQTSIYTAGALVGEFMVSGAGDTFANKLIPYVIAALTTKLAESEPPE